MAGPFEGKQMYRIIHIQGLRSVLVNGLQVY